MKTTLLNKLNNFVNRTSKWKVFFILIPFYFLIFYVSLYCIFYSLSENPNSPEVEILLGDFLIYISLFFSSLMSLLTTTIFKLNEKNVKFLNASKEFEEKFNKITTKNELQELFKNDYQELKKLSLNGTHNNELYRLKSMMDVKYKLIS